MHASQCDATKINGRRMLMRLRQMKPAGAFHQDPVAEVIATIAMFPVAQKHFPLDKSVYVLCGSNTGESPNPANK
jgi:hypothetical protein